ncbi:MAG: LysE family translocator [Chloroflexota bacterium]
MISFITQGMTVGLSAGVMPGPMQSFVMSTSLKHGWRRALLVILTPLIIDIPVIIAVLLALDALQSVVPALVDIIRVIGGAFVLYLAWGAFQDYRSGAAITVADDGTTKNTPNELPRQSFAKGLMMNALSPGPYLFWTTVNGPTLLLALERSFWLGVTYVVTFYVTFLGSLALIALGVSRLRTLDPVYTNRLVLLIAVLLAGFGVFLIVQGLT